MSTSIPSTLDDLQREFLLEVTPLLDACDEYFLNLEKPELREKELGEIFRVAHSIKGTAASVGFQELSDFTHIVEDCLTVLRVDNRQLTPPVISFLLKVFDALKARVQILSTGANPPWQTSALKSELYALKAKLEENATNNIAFEELAEISATSNTDETKSSKKASMANATVKVDIERIDSVLDLTGELVVLKSQLMDASAEYSENSRLISIMSLLDKAVRDLQDKALGMRMTSLKPVFLKLQRLVRDLSVKLGKPVELIVHGEDTEIDRTMIELLADPLMHMARNALDHGIEQPEGRSSANKPPRGTISIDAYQRGGRVVVEIKDDGKGLDKDAILKKAIERGLTKKAPDTDSEIYQYIFHPGLSTAEHITDVSGRGVGMDVVKSNITKIKGTIEITSQKGKGSCFKISIPLTTSITEGMAVTVDEQRYLIPTDRIVELVQYNDATFTQIDKEREVVRIREAIYPLLRLSDYLPVKVQLWNQSQNAKERMIILVNKVSTRLDYLLIQ